MDISFILILIVASVVASFVQRISGFGFGIFIMTILPYILPSYGESISLSGMLAMSQSLVVIIQKHRYLVWKRVLPMLGVFLLFSFLSTSYVAQFDTLFFMHVLGVVLIIFSVYFFFFSSKIHLQPSLPMQLSMGSLSGVLGGFFGMQGPPAVLYFVQSEPDNNYYIAQTQLYFFLGNLFMTIVRFHYGFVTSTMLHSWCYAIVGVALGCYLGSIVFRRISSPMLRKVVYAYMAISGIVAILK